MNGTDAWVFLVARGRYKGYRTILVPDFLGRRGLQGLLSESVDGDHADPLKPRMVTLDTPAGALTVLFRTYRVTSLDVDEDSSPVQDSSPAQEGVLVTDEHGRPLELLYGFVCRAGAVREVSEDDFRAALEQSLHAYRRFLADEDRPFQQSRAFPMRTLVDSVPAPTDPAPRNPSANLGAARTMPEPGTHAPGPEPERSRPGRLIAIGAALSGVTVLFVALLFSVSPGPGGPVTQLEAQVISPQGEVDCVRPVPLVIRAQITTDGPADVRLIVGPVDEPPTQSRQATLSRAGETSADFRFEIRQPINGEIRRYEVVVSEPNRKQAVARYEVRCATGAPDDGQ